MKVRMSNILAVGAMLVVGNSLAFAGKDRGGYQGGHAGGNGLAFAGQDRGGYHGGHGAGNGVSEGGTGLGKLRSGTETKGNSGPGGIVRL
ncbi:MAG TPA: hypothetical protein VER03_08690 [Bryobacteraceae bacterium]|nr:hypothetical protein [Bryobacteraceae bacterium]